jgi:hypothetical protein
MRLGGYGDKKLHFIPSITDMSPVISGISTRYCLFQLVSGNNEERNQLNRRLLYTALLLERTYLVSTQTWI